MSLSYLTSMALSLLAADGDGFVLIIEQAHIDKCAHSNNMEGMIERMNSLFDTVETVMSWAEGREDTAVLVTADHKTGGLSVSADPNRLSDKYTADGVEFSYNFSKTSHDDQHVKLFTYGFEADFSSYDAYSSDFLIKNTDVHRIMRRLLEGEAP